MARSKKSPAKRSGNMPRPDGELRQSQMITTYGPGALVDLIDDAILIPGLEYWSYKGASGYELQEDRLAKNLRNRDPRLKNLSMVAPFRAPPTSASDEQHQGCGVRAIEFPSWFLCPAKDCERLIHKRDTQLERGRRTHRCMMSTKKSRLVPVRFATACPNGHLDDFPWNFFVHKERQGGSCEAPELRLIDRGSGDLSDVIVKCETCMTTRSLAQARGKQSLPACRGKRPWLGVYPEDRSVAEECTEEQRLFVRTASNGYFSQVESALTIPKTSKLDDELLEFFERHYEATLALVTSRETLTTLRQMLPVLLNAPSAVTKLSDAELWLAIENYRAELATDDANERVRETEYRSILNARTEQGDYRYSSADLEEDRNFTAIKPALEDCPLPPGVQDLVLLKRLRELRVLTGFTRLESPSQNIYGEFDIDSRVAALSTSADWLPASEIRGEGFFIELDLERLRAWESNPKVKEREEELRQGFLARFPAKDGDSKPEFLGIRFYLLHTLSHLLITQVALDCGYAASAIRERIYCSSPESSEGGEMAGILLSTGSSGSEGTLGGLVDQGRRIAHHLRRALNQSKLCSHDPVCARQHPTGGHPGRALLGAACHGCMFIAECSCERSNQYLDRALVVPTVTHPDYSFFTEAEMRVVDFDALAKPARPRPAPRRAAPAPRPPPPKAEPIPRVDLEDFDEPWHPVIAALLEAEGVAIEAGGEVAKGGRVVGEYVMLIRRGGKTVHVVDADERSAAKCVAGLSLQGKGAIPFSPSSDDVSELLESLD